MKWLLLIALASAASAAPPSITELQPRGTQKGRPFKLTVVGLNLGEGATVESTLPASFTSLGPDKPGMESRYATYLVEPTAEWSVGVYPVRIRAANGLSNILLFSVGAFPEITEDESQPGSLKNTNDSIERAQTIPSTPLTLNGTIQGPERDVYRVQVKAGERRVFEVDARRAGSAVDPVIRVLDVAGKLIARSEDDPMLQLDARLDVTFPKEGFYYVEVHDARFSAQAQNFYRLKTGTYAYASEMFPLGGRRGEQVEVSLSGTKVKADLTAAKARQVFVNLPESPALPLPFAVGTYPEMTEPVAGALVLPVTVNGRLGKTGEVDQYEIAVKPGEEFIFELQARELGTSKITGLITVYDAKGKKLASAGDGPLPVDVAAVQVSSRTLGDPYLPFKAPEGVDKIRVAVEDLALRGGPHFAYRLTAYRAPFDFIATIATPFVNIPAGGTALVVVNVERRGYAGPIRIEAIGLPKGVTAAGGDIPAELPDPQNRATTRRAILTLTAAADTNLSAGEIGFKAIGDQLERAALGIGYAIGVAGANTQGVVDRQRALTGGWLGAQLPAAMTDPTPATLALTLESSEKKESGYEFRYRWNWSARDTMLKVPDTVSPDVPNFLDLRIIEMKVDPNDPKSGTFLVTSTRNTVPALYDIVVSGRLMVDGAAQEIYAPLLTLTVPALGEEKSSNANQPAAR